MLLEALDVVRGLMMMSYPGYHGLGEWETIRLVLENQEDSDERIMKTDDLEVDKTTLWCCSKELQRGKTFADHFGKNEKSKLVIKATMTG